MAGAAEEPTHVVGHRAYAVEGGWVASYCACAGGEGQPTPGAPVIAVALEDDNATGGWEREAYPARRSSGVPVRHELLIAYYRTVVQSTVSFHSPRP